jgi:hypothetical protein
MEVAASAITLLTAALQSTKVTYQFVSALKDGPQEVQRLSLAIANLHSVLSQLSNLLATSAADPARDLTALSVLVRACNTDLCCLEKEFCTLRPSDHDTKTKVFWKRVKATLREKDLERMWIKLNHHTAELTVQLNILQ